MRLSEIRTIAVLGAGQMGSGIAQLAAQHGFAVRLSDQSLERARAGRASIERGLARLVDKGKLDAAQSAALVGRIEPSEPQAALERAELVIEAASENLEVKLGLLEMADRWAQPEAILASNTSSLSITRLAAATRRPAQVVGMHFMNPVPVMKLVELVRGLETSEMTLAVVRELAETLNKTVIVSQDRPGFLINRMLIPFINEACFALEEGTGTLEHIDLGARFGLNHPLGPFELADWIGLDTVLAIAEVLQGELGDDKYRPAVALRQRVAAGWLGRKSGRGFYVYDAQGKKVERSPER